MHRERLKIGVSACFLYPDPQRNAFAKKTLQYIEQSVPHWVMSGGAMPVMIPSPVGDVTGARDFSGTEGTLWVGEGGWTVTPEPKKKSLEAIKKPAGKDARPAHVRNFLDCVKSRENPVENVEIGHYVSNIAHLGNLAFRTNSEIHWDVDKEVAIGNPAADALVAPQYRAPWKLNYGRRSV